ncbi:MAG: hypothetical protein ACOC95_00360 [Planctomycetota bacterium]
MKPLAALTKRAVIAVVTLGIVLVVLVLVAWPSMALWRAKRQAMAQYAGSQDYALLNTVPADEVRHLEADPSEGERVSTTLESYRYSLPADAYILLPQKSTYVDFESDVLKVRILGTGPLTSEFRKRPMAPTEVTDYFTKTDPWQIVVDAFNARPDDISRQKTQAALDKHRLLLLLKATLAPIGMDTHWENVDTGRYRGNVAGDTSLGGITVMLYLPETQDFANIVLFPTDGATMTDVYDALANLRIEPTTTASA